MDKKEKGISFSKKPDLRLFEEEGQGKNVNV
jgi:hypothetical protein